jgi:HK97 family phage portal protein
MAIVQTFGSLQAMTDPAPSLPTMGRGSLDLYGLNQTYAAIYASQPNVRTCVDFLARNIGQLAFHVFRRVSDTDRVRLHDHELVQWLGHPNPATRRYRLIESLVADLGIYFNAYWLKARLPDRIGLLRLPPEQMTVIGGLLPRLFRWTVNGRFKDFLPSEIVYFNGYNPLNPLMGLSPMETLRRILAEEAAAGEHRQYFWQNASRIEGVIERPKDAPKWTPAQKESWRTQWQERFAGGANAGLVAVLEEGMTFKPNAWSAKDSEYTLARKLAREECTASYHIPLPMVGILEHATFSNIREQHKHLYADCLGPWLEMISEEFEAQLLVECEDREDVYGEFNINEKLKGSFEEQASAIQTFVGRPVMTANEGRGRLNLPRIDDDPSADRLASQQGGPSDASARAPRPALDDASAAAVEHVLRATWQRQAARLTKLPVAQRPEALNHARCTAELAADLLPILGRGGAQEYAARVTDDTYTRLLEGADAFAADREVLPCPL